MSRLLSASALILLGALSLPAQNAPTTQPVPADNTKVNERDRQSGAVTADQQKLNANDTKITKDIRAMVMKDKSLSTYAHNVKIVTQDGKVTLKGPVRSEEEKAAVEQMAKTVAGAANVSNEIEIAPDKNANKKDQSNP